jgi:hypothetical protein
VLDDRDAVDIRRRHGKNPLYTNAIGDFADREGLGETFSLDLDDVAPEGLNPGFLALGNSGFLLTCSCMKEIASMANKF